MAYTSGRRDRFRMAVVGVTGLVSTAAIGATGLLAGLAARQYDEHQAAKDSAHRAAAARAARARAAYETKLARYRAAQTSRPVVIIRHRRVVTQVVTRYVSAAPAAGGTVTASGSGTYQGASGSTGAGSPPPAGGGAAPAPPRRRPTSTSAAPAAPAAGPVDRLMSTTTATRTWATFPCLGTSAFLAVREPGDLTAAEASARALIDLVDRTCSRFREDSDLADVNRNPGRWVEVDPMLVAAVTVARDAARHTGGLVDPLLGRPLVELGYDRDFALVATRSADVRAGTPWLTTTPTYGCWEQIGIDPAGAVRIPEGTALDLGATGKAWTADLIAATWLHELRGAGLICLGGDLRIARPDGAPWQVAIGDRPDEAAAIQVSVDEGGLATSSTRIRRWSRRGVRLHHVLDPRTGRPAADVWRTVSATGPTCSAANTASTAAIVLGHDAIGWLESRGVDARLVALDGAVRTVGRWPEETGDPGEVAG